MNERPIAAVAIVIVAIGAGLAGYYLRGSPQTEGREIEFCPEPRAVLVAKREEGHVCLDELASVKQQRDFYRGLLDATVTSMTEDSLPWPDEVAPLYSVDFEANLRDALESCDIQGIEVSQVDCSEPPCLGLLHVSDQFGWNGELADCPVWRDNYGSHMASASGVVDCGDGRREVYAIVGVPADVVLGEAQDAVEADHRSARTSDRFSNLRDDWVCRGQ